MQEIISHTIARLESLHELLRRERAAMESRDAARISLLAAEKNALMGSIAEQEPDLVEWLDNTDAEDALRQSIIDLIELCADLNQQNRSYAMVELKHSRLALNYLRGLLNLNDTSLYGKSGELATVREKRNLGSA